MSVAVRQVLHAYTMLGESPLWVKETQTLLYIDIMEKKVFNYNPVTETFDYMGFDQHVGFAIPILKNSEDLFVCVGLEDQIVEANFSKKEIKKVIVTMSEEIYVSGARFNDGKCNTEGKLFAGYMNPRKEKQTKWIDNWEGEYYELKSDNKLHKLLIENGIHLPNGTAWIDKTNFYLIDSGANEILKVELNEEKETIKRNIVYKLSEEYVILGYMMDGMTIDSKGNLWVALVGSSSILQIDPINGKEIFKFKIDSSKPTSCAFGGEDLSDLYITTIKEDHEEIIPKGNLYVAKIEGVYGMRFESSLVLSEVS